MVGNMVKNPPKPWPFSGDMYFSGKWLIAQYTVSEIFQATINGSICGNHSFCHEDHGAFRSENFP